MFKYLFKALLKNGNFIEQTQEDKSLTVPGRNCFYDVLQKQDDLRAFGLYNQETGDEWLIDLSDCHFEHNIPVLDKHTGITHYIGSNFKLHGDAELTNIRLIWYLSRKIELDIVNTKIMNNIISNYNFGFQGNLPNGENKQFVITLSGS